MSKYKSLDEPITRREACLILDRRRFDAAVRSGELTPLGKLGSNGEPDTPKNPAGVTSPLLFDQEAVRVFTTATAQRLATDARDLRLEAKEVARREPPLTRRQVAQVLGKKLTGVLIRSGRLAPDGKLTDTQTAAHTYNPADVAALANALADERYAESKLLARATKTRVPS